MRPPRSAAVLGLLVVVALSFAGCNCGQVTPSDGGVDAGELPVDAGPPDAGPPDAGPPDAGPPDAGPPDAGPGGVDAGCVYGPDGGPTIPDGGLVCISTGTVPGFLYYARAAADAGLPGTIWVRSGDGLVDHLVTSGGRPTLSSDGRFMGFLRDGTNGAVEGSRGDLWVRDLATGAELKLFTNDDYVVFGSFVPDSGVLVFDYLCQLAQVPVDGGPTAAFPGFGGCYTDMPAVSPSGRRVAIRNLQSGLGMEDFDGQNARWILPAVAGHTASYPRWAPNEERLSYIFGPLDDGRGEARSIQPDGGGDAPLSITDVCGAPLVLSGPAVWTADGRWAVAAGVGQGVSALWAMAADGGGEVMRLCVADGPPVIFSGGQAFAWPDGGAR